MSRQVDPWALVEAELKEGKYPTSKSFIAHRARKTEKYMILEEQYPMLKLLEDVSEWRVAVRIVNYLQGVYGSGGRKNRTEPLVNRHRLEQTNIWRAVEALLGWTTFEEAARFRVRSSDQISAD